MTLLNIIQFHPLRDTLPDGTELRLVLPVERTNNKPLYITSDGRPFSHVYVKDKSTGDYRFEYHPIKPIFDTSKTNKYNGNRKQKYLKMTRTYGYILIHHAVALAFIGPRPVERLPPSPKFPFGRLHPYDCHHLNGITTDNRASNLIWLSKADHRRFDDALAKGLILTRTDPDCGAEPNRDYDPFIERD